MGCGAAVMPNDVGPKGFRLIPDQYTSYEELTAALRKSGLEKSQLIIGVDFTQSNLDTGAKTFGGRSLHCMKDPGSPNPYWQALNIVAKALWDFDDDHQIPIYGFGDASSGNAFVFSFETRNRPCKGLLSALKRYETIAGVVTLAGPTSFAPLIRQAISIVRETNEYHILVIIADGQVSAVDTQATAAAIVEASNYSLSIVMVGVGDGPWGLMDKFDDELPERQFDNFQFVDFSDVFKKYPKEKAETAFATHALMEIPDQYRAILQLGLLDGRRPKPSFRPVPKPLGPPDSPDPQDPSYGLPEGWVAVYDYKKARYFYFSKKANTGTWERPTSASCLPQGKPAESIARRFSLA